MSNYNHSGYMSEPRQKNVVDNNISTERRESVAKATVGESTFNNGALPRDIANQFCEMKFSEQRYASARCRIDIAKSYLCDAKKHLKKGDDIAALAYMQCSMSHISRAMLELCDTKNIDIRKNNFTLLKELSFVFNKIIRGDFFVWPRDSFSQALKETEIFIGDAEAVLLNYLGGNDYETI